MLHFREHYYALMRFMEIHGWTWQKVLHKESCLSQNHFLISILIILVTTKKKVWSKKWYFIVFQSHTTTLLSIRKLTYFHRCGRVLWAGLRQPHNTLSSCPFLLLVFARLKKSIKMMGVVVKSLICDEKQIAVFNTTAMF